MRCAICGISVGSIEEAIERNWALSFFEGDIIHGPACKDCYKELLHIRDNGDVQVKEAYCGKIMYLDNGFHGEGNEPIIVGYGLN
jgi:hypothetical protein